MISAGLAGASGAHAAPGLRSGIPGFAGRRLSSDGYTAFLGVFGTGPGACSRSAPASSPSGCAPGGAPRDPQRLGLSGRRPRQRRLARPSAGGRVSRPSGRLRPPLPDSSALGRRRGRDLRRASATAILGWLGRRARRRFRASLAPAVVAAASRRSAGHGAAGRGCQPPRCGSPGPGAQPAAPLCLGGGLAEIYRPRLEAALPRAVLPAERTARSDPRRLAGRHRRSVPPEYPDVA